MTTPPHDFLAMLRQRVVLFDGGMGSMLIAAGLGKREVPEAWVLSQPGQIAAVHEAYLAAGADVLTTCTFGANAIKLHAAQAGRALEAAAVNEQAVAIARRCIEKSGQAALVAGDIGPTGQFFPPVGKLDAAQARQAFAEQAAALERAGVDLLLIETMYDIREAVEAVRAVRQVSRRPVAVTLTFDRRPKGFFTLMGDSPAKAAAVLPGEGADVLGANCSLASEAMIELAGQFRRVTPAPLLFQPNAGQPVMQGELATYRQDPRQFAADIAQLVALGVSAVGGCCGTTPDFIREIRDLLHRQP